MSYQILCKDSVTGAPTEPTCTNGKLDVNATVSPPEGGATEAKQDAGNTTLSTINGKVPALGQALAAASVPVVLPAAQITTLAAPVLAAGTAVIGSVVCANSGGTATFPTASALSNSSAGNPTTTKIGAVIMGREENGDTLRRVRTTSQNDLYVQPLAIALSTTSRTSGSSYEAQRGVNFGCSPTFVRCFVHPDAVNATRVAAGKSATRFYLLFVNKSSAAANGEAPLGADAIPVEADTCVQVDMSGCSEAFTSGCQVVLSETPHLVTLPGSNYGRFTIIGN
jgi:hypothetical protein